MFCDKITCITNIVQFYGLDLELSKLKKFSLNPNLDLSFQRLAKESSLNLKKIFCKDLKLSKNLIFPIIAEVKLNVKNNLKSAYLFILNQRDLVLEVLTSKGIKSILLDDFQKIFVGKLYLLTPKKDFKKSHGSFNDIARFFVLLKLEKKNFAKIFCASLMLCVFGVLTAFYFRFLIDEVFNAGLSNMLNVFSFAFFMIITFQCLLSFARNQLLNFLGHKMDANIVTEYFSHVFKLPMSFFSKVKTGEIVSRMYDSTTIRNLISVTFLSIAIDAIMLVFGAIFLFLFGSKLLLVSIISVACGAIVASVFVKPYRIKMDERAKAEAIKYSCMVEFVNGIETIKALSATEVASEKCESKIINAAKKNLNIRTITNLQNTIQYFIQQVTSLFIYWLGGKAIINGQMSLGQLISFVILSQYFIGPLFRVLTLQSTFQEAKTAARRLIDIFDEPIEQDDGIKISSGKLKGEIEFNDVSFSYSNKKDKTIEDLNFKIKRGEKIAFVGESGSGKSTVAKLLMKFQNISKGEIKIDGKNINNYDIDFLRENIGYIPQDALLFSGSLLENISFGNNYFSEDDLFIATSLAKANKFIEKLPNRYESYVGERGATLSGGERQRITIARMLLSNPQMLILDESTSALDNMLEAEVIKSIKEIYYDKTLILISHKLSIVKDFDKIFVFDNGKIIEAGSHAQLLNMGGKYFQLWCTQNMEILDEKINGY